MLARNITITDRDELNRLKSLGASQFVLDNEEKTPRSEDETAREPVPSEDLTIVEKSHETIHSGVQQQKKLYDNTLNRMKDLFPKVESGGLPEKALEEIKDSIHEFIDETRRNPAIIGALTQSKTFDDYTYQHSLNVSLLTTLYGAFMKDRKIQA